MSLWLVRAGRHGEREELALQHNVAIIGWSQLPDLSSIRERRDLGQLLEQRYPEAKAAKLKNWEGQLWAFIHRIERNDLVALPLKQRATIALGSVTGPYRYDPSLPEDARHTRPVEWLKELPRSAFDQDLLYSLGAFMTVCQVRRNEAEKRVRALLEGAPAGLPDDSEDSPDEMVAPDLEEFARDQIRDCIGRTFTGHDLAHLIGAVLQAQGYQVHVSPPGPDGGVDLLCGKGPLGFDPPRLAVQVKSGSTPADVKVLRELQGVMHNFRAEQGLFVSWGGYRGSVAKEVARSFFETRIWDADDVVRQVEVNYDRLPDELQAKLPLKRIWTLVQPAEEE